MTAFRYSIVRYVPDPVRGEQLNVGVVVAADDPDFFGARFLSDRQTGRLKRLGMGIDFGFIRDLADEMRASSRGEGELPLGHGAPTPRWSAAELERAAIEWANTVQLSRPLTALHADGNSLVDELFVRYVSDRSPRRERARDRRWVRRKVSTGIRRTLVELEPEIDPDGVLHRDEKVDGALEEHRFDYALRNGHLVHAVQTLSFESSDLRSLKTEVDATAWAIDDVRSTHADLPISVVTIGGGKLVTSAASVYEGLGAQLVRERDIDEWISTVARETLDHLA
jgi:hypothetical protein